MLPYFLPTVCTSTSVKFNYYHQISKYFTTPPVTTAGLIPVLFCSRLMWVCPQSVRQIAMFQFRGGYACCASHCRFCLVIFTARCYAQRGLCCRKMSVCLFVRLFICLSHASILSERLNISSNCSHRRVATPFQFVYTKYGNIPTATITNGVAECRGYEKSGFSTNKSLYLGNDTRQSHGCCGMRIENRTQGLEVPL